MCSLPKKIDVVQDEEHENASGGHTCYSDGVKDSSGEFQKYVIVTALNTCPMRKSFGIMCAACGYHFTIGPTMYCSGRWKGHDRYDKESNTFQKGEKNW